MGFFSWDCKRCDHPLLGPAGLDPDGRNAWMQQGVALTKRGDRIVGDYDGYGRLDDTDIWGDGEPAVYHAACYELEGRPEFTSPSRSSDDQGYFFKKGSLHKTELCRARHNSVNAEFRVIPCQTRLTLLACGLFGSYSALFWAERDDERGL